MRHRNETCGWHVCAGRVTNVADLDLAVARTGPHDGGSGRVSDAPGGPEVGEHLPKESGQDIAPVARHRAKSLRAQERSVDCGDTRRRSRRRGLARARAAPRERIRGAGRYGQGRHAPWRRNRARRSPVAGCVLK